MIRHKPLLIMLTFLFFCGCSQKEYSKSEIDYAAVTANTELMHDFKYIPDLNDVKGYKTLYKRGKSIIDSLIKERIGRYDYDLLPREFAINADYKVWYWKIENDTTVSVLEYHFFNNVHATGGELLEAFRIL